MDPINPWVDTEAVRKLAQSLLVPIPREPEPERDACFSDEFVGFAGASMPSAPPSVQESSALPASAEPEHLRLQDQARESLAGARQQAEQGGLLVRSSAPASELANAPETQPVTPGAGAAESAEGHTPDSRSEPAPVSSPVAVAPAPPEHMEAPFVERLHAYGQWLLRAINAKAFFVTDRDGHVLMDQVRSPKLLQVARTLAQASHTASRHAGVGEVGSLHVKLGPGSILEVLPVETTYGPLILGIVVPSVLGAEAIPVISQGLEQVGSAQGG